MVERFYGPVIEDVFQATTFDPGKKLEATLAHRYVCSTTSSFRQSAWAAKHLRREGTGTNSNQSCFKKQRTTVRDVTV